MAIVDDPDLPALTRAASAWSIMRLRDRAGERMGLISIEHSKASYRADFALYGAGVLALAAFLLAGSPPGRRLASALLALAGLLGWSLIEYALHRFVLHGVQPFRRWHEQHHDRPRALLGAPTILSATLIATLVFAPALIASNRWYACALTLGVTSGYLAYGITHHATHHWRLDNAWLRERKRWHALHHHVGPARCFGVTSTFWDHVFGSAGPARRGLAGRRHGTGDRSTA